MSKEQEYRIRVGTVAVTAPDGWSTSVQVPEFSVRASSPGEAARKAKRIMLAAATDENARAHFGMLDEGNNYFDEQEADRNG